MEGITKHVVLFYIFIWKQSFDLHFIHLSCTRCWIWSPHDHNRWQAD